MRTCVILAARFAPTRDRRARAAGVEHEGIDPRGAGGGL